MSKHSDLQDQQNAEGYRVQTRTVKSDELLLPIHGVSLNHVDGFGQSGKSFENVISVSKPWRQTVNLQTVSTDDVKMFKSLVVLKCFDQSSGLLRGTVMCLTLVLS